MGNGNAVYNSQLDAFTLYHVVNETSSPFAGVGPALPALGHALAGAVGSASAKALTYPLDLVVTRLQVQKQMREKGETASAAKDADAEYAGLVDAATKIYNNEGAAAFFAGCAGDVGKGVIDSFLFFLAYTFLRNDAMRKSGEKSVPIAKDLAIGVAAGCFSKFVTTPIANVVTRQQTAAMRAARDPSSSSASASASMRDMARQIYDERGVAGFWAGYNAQVILTMNPAITFAVDNVIRRLLPKARSENPGPYLTFLIAATSKGIATSITYPVQLAKSRAQAGGNQDDDNDDDGDDEHPEKDGPAGILGKPAMNSTPRRRQVKSHLQKALGMLWAQYAIYRSLRKIYRSEGVAGLYSGLEGDVLKGFLTHGLTMMTKEKVHIGVIQTYYLLLKLTRQWEGELKKAQDKLTDVGETVSEGAKKLADRGQKAAGL